MIKEGRQRGKKLRGCQVLCEGHFDVSLLLMTPTSGKLFCLLCWGTSSHWPHSVRAWASPDHMKLHLPAPVVPGSNQCHCGNSAPSPFLLSRYRRNVPHTLLQPTAGWACTAKGSWPVGADAFSFLYFSVYSALLFFPGFISLSLSLFFSFTTSNNHKFLKSLENEELILLSVSLHFSPLLFCLFNRGQQVPTGPQTVGCESRFYIWRDRSRQSRQD